MMAMNDTQAAGEASTMVVCAALSQLSAAIAEKRKEGWEPLGAPVGTGAKVVIEDHEIPKMAQTMIRRRPLVSSDEQDHTEAS